MITTKPRLKLNLDGSMTVLQPAIRTLTLHDFVEQLSRSKQTAAEWAEQHGFDRQDVYMVLRGATRGRRGKAREVLKAMGVTPPPALKVRAHPMTDRH